MTHICVSELTIIGSDNVLPPGRRQAIIWTNAGILLIPPPGTNLNEILNKIHIISFKKIHLKMSSGKWRPFCLGLNVLIDPLGTNFHEILIAIQTFSFTKMHLKMLSVKWLPFCLYLNLLKYCQFSQEPISWLCNHWLRQGVHWIPNKYIQCTSTFSVCFTFLPPRHYSDVKWLSCRLRLLVNRVFV